MPFTSSIQRMGVQMRWKLLDIRKGRLSIVWSTLGYDTAVSFVADFRIYLEIRNFPRQVSRFEVWRKRGRNIVAEIRTGP